MYSRFVLGSRRPDAFLPFQMADSRRRVIRDTVTDTSVVVPNEVYVPSFHDYKLNYNFIEPNSDEICSKAGYVHYCKTLVAEYRAEREPSCDSDSSHSKEASHLDKKLGIDVASGLANSGAVETMDSPRALLEMMCSVEETAERDPEMMWAVVRL